MDFKRVIQNFYFNALIIVFISMEFASAESISIFYDQTSGPISFAANDIKTALVANVHTVELHNLSDLKTIIQKKSGAFFSEF